MKSSILFNDEETDSILEAQLQGQEDKTASKKALARLFGRLFQKIQVRVVNFIIAIESEGSEKNPALLFRMPELVFSDNCESDEEDLEESIGIQKKLSFQGFSLDLVPDTPANAIYQTIPASKIQPIIVAEKSPVEHEVLINIGNLDEMFSSIQVVCNFQTVKFGITPLQVRCLLEILEQINKGHVEPTPTIAVPEKRKLNPVTQPLTPEDKIQATMAKREVVTKSSRDVMDDSFFKSIVAQDSKEDNDEASDDFVTAEDSSDSEESYHQNPTNFYFLAKFNVLSVVMPLTEDSKDNLEITISDNLSFMLHLQHRQRKIELGYGSFTAIENVYDEKQICHQLSVFSIKPTQSSRACLITLTSENGRDSCIVQLGKIELCCDLFFPKRLSSLIQSLMPPSNQDDMDAPVDKSADTSNYEFNFVGASARLKLKVPKGSRFACAPETIIVDLLCPNAKFQSGELEAQQYWLGFDDLLLSLGLSHKEVRIATLKATANGVSTEPIQITLHNPACIEPLEPETPVLPLQEDYHLYSSVVFDKTLNENWFPFEEQKEPHCMGPFGRYLSVHEHEDSVPKPHDKSGFASFLYKTRERSLCDIHMILPSTVVQIDKTHYNILLSLVGLLSTASGPAQPEEAQNKPSELSSISFHLTVTTCDVLLVDGSCTDFQIEDMSVFYVSDYEGTDTTYFCVTSDIIKVVDSEKKEVLSTQKHFSKRGSALQQTSSKPAIQFISANYTRGDVIHNLVWLGFNGLTFNYEKGDSWALKIRDFFASPVPSLDEKGEEKEKEKEVVRTPNTLKFFLDFDHCSIEHLSPSCKTSLAVLANDLLIQYKTSFDGHKDITSPVTATFTDARFFVADTKSLVSTPCDARFVSWEDRGYIEVGNVDFLRGELITSPTFLISITNNILTFAACSDSMKLFLDTITNLLGSSDPVDDDRKDEEPKEVEIPRMVVVKLEPIEPEAKVRDKSRGASGTWLKKGWSFEKNILPDYSNKSDDEASITEQLPQNYPPKDKEFRIKDFTIRWRLLDGTDLDGKRGAELMTVDLSNITIRRRTFLEPVPGALPAQEPVTSRIDFTIADIEITDRHPDSTYNRFLCYDERELRIGKRSMVRVILEEKPPNNIIPRINHQLRVSLLPFCLHMDQDAYLFFLDYIYSTFGLDTQPKEPEWVDVPAPNPAEDFFFESAIFNSLKLTIDYKPKHVNVGNPHFSELVNLVPVDFMTVSLSKVRIVDIPGWHSLRGHLYDAWSPQVVQCAPLAYLSGIRYIRPFYNIGSGFVDLVWMPYDQYTQDGNWRKGLQRGTSSFATKVASGVADLGARATVGATVGLETLEGVIDDKSNKGSTEQQEFTSKFASQAPTAIDGLREGYQALVSQLVGAGTNFVVMPEEEFQKYGVAGYVLGTMKAVPLAFIKPALGATDGLSRVIMGVKNQVDTSEKKLMDGKYGSNKRGTQ
eukprot:TRINITY_DN7474_c0_g1_i1.p1 TRINITY_DN7474_c0_g1~~TRINITY_DN7474_c0_g1_i1.p1  ORF type:complete len:1571 (-),score=250.66 TRINITY_DN7474_c0_g1_i1:78-4415(-)